VLTAQTYVNVGACPETPVSGTLVFAGNCVQTISRFPIMATSAGRFTVQENVFNYSPVCFSAAGFDSGAFTPDEPGGTFTATATGFTRFTANAAAGNPNPDRVEVYARR
jgi:hypothetical protein